MRELTKLEELYIRACKTQDPLKRLHSIYRRFYLADPTMANSVIADNLAEIVSEFNLMNIQRYIQIVSPQNQFTYSNSVNDDYWLKTVTALYQVIRYKGREDLPEFTKPLRFKIKGN